MLSTGEIIILVIVLMGFPIITLQAKRHKQMLLAFLGYCSLLLSSVTALFTFPGSTSVIALARSIFIMSTGIFFAGAAVLSYKRMKGVVK